MSDTEPVSHQEKIPDILSDREKRFFSEATTNLMRQFAEDYPDKLPDGIILPDTSGRALWPLLDPILTKLSEQRGVEKPKFYFLPVSKGSVNIQDDIDNYKDELEMGGLSSWEEADISRTIEYLQDNLKNYNATAKAYANGIKEDLRKNGKDQDNIVVFDDFFSTGNTYSKVSKAFGGIPHWYVLGIPPYETWHETGGAIKYGRRVASGEIQNFVGNSRVRRAIGVKKTYIGIRGVGGELSEEEVKAFSSPTVGKLKSQLRQEMREIGEEVARQIA